MMEQSPFVLEPGALIAERYRLLRPLGSGGSAYVWAALDEALEREVAVKVLSASASQGGRERERLHREARLLALLEHPRITTVYDYVEMPGPNQTCDPVLVTELVHGSDLRSRLDRGPLSPEAAFTVCAEVAEALAAAHRASIVHRDVKPGNVMMTDRGAKLLDFGISRRSVDTDLTGQVAIGTPACMAPEQWRGQPSQPASDIYALGCMLYWCLSGHAPYADREMPALGVAHLTEEPPELPAGALVDVAIPELYRACTRKDPDERPSAADAARALRDAAAAPVPAPVLEPATVPIPFPVPAAAAASASASAAVPVGSDPQSTRVSVKAGRGHVPATVVALAVAAVIGTGIAIPVLLAAHGGSGPSAGGENSASLVAVSHSASAAPNAGGSAGTANAVVNLQPSGSRHGGSSRGHGSNGHDPSGKASYGNDDAPGQSQNTAGGPPPAVEGSPSDQASAADPSQTSNPGTSASPTDADTAGPSQQASPGAAPAVVH